MSPRRADEAGDLIATADVAEGRSMPILNGRFGGMESTHVHKKVHQPRICPAHGGMVQGAGDRGGADARSCTASYRRSTDAAETSRGPDVRRLWGGDQVWV